MKLEWNNDHSELEYEGESLEYLYMEVTEDGEVVFTVKVQE